MVLKVLKTFFTMNFNTFSKMNKIIDFKLSYIEYFTSICTVLPIKTENIQYTFCIRHKIYLYNFQNKLTNVFVLI